MDEVPIEIDQCQSKAFQQMHWLSIYFRHRKADRRRRQVGARGFGGAHQGQVSHAPEGSQVRRIKGGLKGILSTAIYLFLKRKGHENHAKFPLFSSSARAREWLGWAKFITAVALLCLLCLL